MPDSDDTPLPADGALPTNLGGLHPGELLARGMQTAKISSTGAHGWEPPTIGEVARLFPNYDVLAMLGRGGMGAVFKARQIALDRFVAIKLLPLEISVDQAFLDRFRREARVMAKLNHPHIISVYEFGQTSEGHLFFVMEFVEGANLAEIIHQAGLGLDEALALAAQVCTALAYAHGKGVIHRDIKPANVMVDPERQVRVADFGLARLNEPTAETFGATAIGIVMGTPDYMAPEQKRGMNVDHRADIYALGVTLYEMLCRQVPHGIFPRPSERIPCDSRIDRIVVKAMQQEPELRYQSIAEMEADIVAARTPLPAPEPAAPAPPVLAALRVFQESIGMEPRLLPAPVELDGPVASLPEPPPPPPPSGKALYSLLAFAVLATLVGTIDWSHWWSASQPKLATKDRPFVNTLGMKFVPVPITGGPSGGQRVLFSVWETRVQDYEGFAKETKRGWPKPGFLQGPTHPAVNVSWDDAQAFCSWLTAHERKAGKLSATECYRLPTDHEWSCAVGIGDREDPAMLPEEKHGKITDVFPWGGAWPPPTGAGNYSGEEVVGYETRTGQQVIAGYRDAFPATAPVGSFAANRLGLHDLGGNALEWCEDVNIPSQVAPLRTTRGASFDNGGIDELSSSQRNSRDPEYRYITFGFRAVVAVAPPAK